MDHLTNAELAEFAEFITEFGANTREAAVVTDEVTTFGFYTDGRMAATQEWLDSKTDAELGEIIFERVYSQFEKTAVQSA